jgi:alanine-synthesizing transaminase
VAVYQERRDALCDGLNKVGWPVTPPRGTMFGWAPIPEEFRDMGSVEFCLMLLEEADVAIAPGAAFGEGGDGFVRMAIVENKQRLRQAVRQIGRALRLHRVKA